MDCIAMLTRIGCVTRDEFLDLFLIQPMFNSTNVDLKNLKTLDSVDKERLLVLGSRRCSLFWRET